MAATRTRAAAQKSKDASKSSADHNATNKDKATSKRKSKAVKAEEVTVKEEPAPDDEKTTPPKKRKRGPEATPPSSTKKSKRTRTKNTIKKEDVDAAITAALPEFEQKYAKSAKKGSKPADLQMKKLSAYSANANQSPFPNFAHPTPEECKLAHRILSDLHGARTRPDEVVASKDSAGCGDSPSVLDALVRTILSQNTSDVNSTRAKRSMDDVYGGSDEWAAIVAGGEVKLEESIRCGGLSKNKAKVITTILNEAKEEYGDFSLDHLFDATDEDAMKELLSLKGVGPKTASCVLLFCLRRDSFAVDTHVWRITGLLGWRPKSASRDETHAHLDARVPAEDKYGLHILLVTHGKRCDECKAGGKNGGSCELRKAFRKGKKEDIEEAEDGVIKEEGSKEQAYVGGDHSDE